MGGYQGYPEYRDSGVAWLGEVPGHWDVNRLGQFFEERREKVSDKDFQPLSVTMQGIVPQLETAAKTDAGDNRKLVLKKDFVINSRSDRKGSSGVSAYDGSVSLISIVLSPRGIQPDFVHHLLRSYPFQEEFYRYGKGIVADLWSTNSSEMKNILIPNIPVAEQTQIAAFLDHETAKIDALIEKQQTFIALLKEKRQAVISHAVTKGLNPDVAMRDSGVEWLGEVPEEWVVCQLRRVIDSIEQGWSPEAYNQPCQNDELGVIKLSAIKKGVFFPEENKTLPVAINLSKANFLQTGDFLLTRANTPELVGDACVIGEVPLNHLILSDLVYRLNLLPVFVGKYLCYWMISTLGRVQIKRDARGSSMSMAKIGQGHIKSWLLPLPSIDEQNCIVKYLDTKLERIEKTIDLATQNVVLLRERRVALISAAVTGKIDVRNWQAPAQD